MLKRTQKIIIFVFYTLVTFGAIGFLIEGFSPIDYSKSSYEIIDVSSDVRVSSKNEYFISDLYTIDFKERNDYFAYKIQTKEKNYKINIKNIDTGNYKHYIQKEKDGGIVLLIPNKNSVGRNLIRISYTLDKGNDYDTTHDYFSHKILAVDPSKVNSCSFKITFPKNLLSEKITYGNILGNQLIADSVNLNISEVDNTITGMYFDERTMRDNIEVDLDLSEGYFENADYRNRLDKYIIIAYLVICFVFFIVWFLKGRDERITTKPIFNAPNNLSPLEYGYWIDKSFEYSDMFYMILYWANKGYLKIKSLKKSNYNDKRDFIISKLKPLDINAPDYEKTLFDAFFEVEDEERTPGEFCTMAFRNVADGLFGTLQTYAMNMQTAQEQFFSHMKENENEGYDAGAESLFNTMKVTTFLLWGFAIYYYASSNLFSFMSFIPILIVIATAIFGIFMDKDSFHEYILWTLPLAIIVSITKINLIVLGIIVILTLLTVFVRKRTFEYNSLLGDLIGFKNVITSKKYRRQIEEIANSNPNYFYEVLPYAFILFSEDYWIKQFTYITSPSWYESEEGEELNRSTISNFATDMNDLFISMLEIVNNSATAKKRKVSREGLPNSAKMK